MLPAVLRRPTSAGAALHISTARFAPFCALWLLTFGDRPSSATNEPREVHVAILEAALLEDFGELKQPGNELLGGSHEAAHKMKFPQSGSSSMPAAASSARAAAIAAWMGRPGPAALNNR